MAELRNWQPGYLDRFKYGIAKLMGDDRQSVRNAEKITGLLEYAPVVGDVMAGAEAVDEFSASNYGTAGLLGAAAVAGLVPGVGDAAAKGVKSLVKKTKPSGFGKGYGDIVSYTDPETGAYMNIVKREGASRDASVIDLYVPEEHRNKGVAKKLLAQVMEENPSLMGQVSSKFAARNAYKAGRRPIDNPNATLEDVFSVIDEYSSVNMATPNVVSPIQQRGDEVLGLLKAGRAEEVTDDMLDMGNAADNANLNAYLFENYDLPMDEASRMGRAQEMGFDTGRPVYHGSPDARSIKAQGFDDQTQSVMRDVDWEKGVKKPIFTSDSRRVAATYADDKRAFDYQNAEPAVLDLLRRSGNDVFIDAQGARFRGLDIRDVEAGTGADMSKYRGQIRDGEMSTDGLGLVLSDQGRDGAIIQNVVDDYMGYGDPSQVQMTVDPRDLRFRSARFDPRLKHLRNLSAGVGGLGLLGAGGAAYNAEQDGPAPLL